MASPVELTTIDGNSMPLSCYTNFTTTFNRYPTQLPKLIYVPHWKHQIHNQSLISPKRERDTSNVDCIMQRHCLHWGEMDSESNSTTAERNFIHCNYCEKPFRYQCHMKVHQRVHTKDKPYVCIICYRRFRQSGSLKVHMRRHTGEKPFRCDTCKRTFRHSNSLRRHERKLHKSDREAKNIADDILKGTDLLPKAVQNCSVTQFATPGSPKKRTIPVDFWRPFE